MKKILYVFLAVFLNLYFLVSCNEVSDDNLLVTTFDSETNVSSGYQTGDYDEYENYNIGCYRTYANSKRIFTTILKTPTYLSDFAPSCVYNINAIKGIRKFELDYKCDDSFYILSSNDKSYDTISEIPASSERSTYTVTLDTSDTAAFFKICAQNETVTLYSVNVYYNNKTKPKSTSDTSYDASRINMSDFYTDYNLTEGETRQIPSNIIVTGNNYTVSEYKTYTYHSFEYVKESQTNQDELALTDPIDVASYYMLFHTWPVNYFMKDRTSDGGSYFSPDKIRCVSEYTRTDGYATSVPYKCESGKNYPLYYELDFDASGYYSTTTRGVGRLVVWVNGFTCSSYDTNPVIVYTNDHYSTFKEFLNCGQYSPYFNAEGHSTGKVHTAAKTLTKEN